MPSLLVITGSGISKPSGIPTYRENDTTTPILDFNTSSNQEQWDWCNDLRAIIKHAQPNDAHYTLVEMEKQFDRFLIATQNVDGLHQLAGSQHVTELHGNIWQIAKPRALDYADDPQFEEDQLLLDEPAYRNEILQRWSHENNYEVCENKDVPYLPTDENIRPNVLFLSESYGNRLLWVTDFIKRGVDTILLIGCSGSVHIVSTLIASAKEINPNCRVISINPREHSITGIDEDIRLPAIEGLKEFCKRISKSSG